MSAATSIEWTDATWNPVRGCSRVSPGCEHCYAEGVAARFSGPGMPYEGLARRAPNGEPRWTGALQVVPKLLDQPLRWKKPRRIFVNSMSDLFHESLSFKDIATIFAVMGRAEHHTFQVLTKRAERMRDFVDAWNHGRLDTFALFGMPLPLPNVWLGVSVENQEAADERIPLLLQTLAAVRFLSIEPLLGPVDLHRLRGETCGVCGNVATYSALYATTHCACCVEGDESVAWGPLSWVIVGGESGPKARPMHPQWARDLRDQCVAAEVPFFFKQWGEFADLSNDEPGSELLTRSLEDRIFTADGRVLGAGYRDGRKTDGMVEATWREQGAAWMARVGKKRAGRELDGSTWDEMPRAQV